MQKETVIAGFGGQGVLFTGKVLSYTALEKNMEVTWFPSYGPEMRGGTANCTVIFSDEEIGSPQILKPSAVIAMNQPSLDKYENLVKKDGYLIVNSSMTNREIKRADINIVSLPATELAESLGDKKLANIVLLGALMKASGYFSLQDVEKALKKSLKGKKEDLLTRNKEALNAGADYH